MEKATDIGPPKEDKPLVHIPHTGVRRQNTERLFGGQILKQQCRIVCGGEAAGAIREEEYAKRKTSTDSGSARTTKGSETITGGATGGSA